MPYGNITYLDLIKLVGTDPTVELVEEITTFAPELAALKGRTIVGTSTKLPVRRQLPNVGFRRPNEVIAIGKSEYDMKEASLAFLDAQMRVDVALVGADNSKGMLLAREARGALKNAAITVGNQLYYGAPDKNPTDKGFLGIQNQVDASMIVDAAGTTAATASSVYIVCEGDEYFEMLYGNDGKIGNMTDDWPIFPVYGTDGAGNIGAYDAFTNSLNGWIGAIVGQSKSVACIKNITADAGHTLTDKLLYQAFSKFPVGMNPTKILMNRRTREQLQESRTAVNYQYFDDQKTAGIPDKVQGVPIIVTDSILNTEALR